MTQALRSSAHAASHDEAIPGLNGENIRFPLRPPHHQSETSPSEEAPELSPVPTTPNTEDIEAADRRAEEECRKMYAVDRKAAKHGALPKRAPTPQTPFTPTEEEFPNEPEETHEETHEGEEEESEECNEPDDIIEDDEPKQTKDSHTVMMVSHVSRASDVGISEGESCHVLDGVQPLRERLERLARALGSSQDVPRSSAVQPSPDSDPRQTGWPCWGCHLPKQRSNQHATWSSCTRCALRLSYVAKTGRQGVHRSVGPDPQVLAAALEELQMIYDEGQINEKVVQGKIMEVQGRGLVTTGQGTTSTHVKASQKLGKMLMASEPPTATTTWEEPESPESMSRSDMGGWTEMTGEEVLRAALPKSMAKAKAKPAAERPEQVA